MQARCLPARQGVVWVVAGFRLFRANPPLLTLLTFSYLMVFMIMLILPAGLGGVLFSILQPMLALGIANGCRGIAASGRRGPPPDLTAGIRAHRQELVKLGGLQLVGAMLLMLVLLPFDIKPDPDKPQELLRMMALLSVLSLPLMLAFWFAPLLTGWHGLPALKSAFFSLVAGLRNWRAFLVYGLALMAITVLPALLAMLAPQLLGSAGQFMGKAIEVAVVILVLPIFFAGSYVSYRDIFQITEQ